MVFRDARLWSSAPDADASDAGSDRGARRVVTTGPTIRRVGPAARGCRVIHDETCRAVRQLRRDGSGTRSGDRTRMTSRSRDFKSLASTSFAIRAACAVCRSTATCGSTARRRRRFGPRRIAMSRSVAVRLPGFQAVMRSARDDGSGHECGIDLPLPQRAALRGVRGLVHVALAFDLARARLRRVERQRAFRVPGDLRRSAMGPGGPVLAAIAGSRSRCGPACPA
jgi:hypothetical protein